MEFNKFDIEIGSRLYEARVLKRLTQEGVSKSISERMKQKGFKKGISRQAYAFYESGQRSMPLEVYKIACNVLDIDCVETFNRACDALKIKEENEI